MYFDNCKDLDELKREYRRLALKNHPDRGGSLRIMQAVNAEYDQAFERLSRKQNVAADAGSGKRTAEVPADYKQIIELLIHLEGVSAELCGSWLWISGDTYNYRQELKSAGCRWSKEKSKWYWHPREEAGGYNPRRGTCSMDYIRSKYGSKEIGGTRREKLTA